MVPMIKIQIPIDSTTKKSSFVCHGNGAFLCFGGKVTRGDLGLKSGSKAADKQLERCQIRSSSFLCLERCVFCVFLLCKKAGND
jgi:hypothetical protein